MKKDKNCYQTQYFMIFYQLEEGFRKCFENKQ